MLKSIRAMRKNHLGTYFCCLLATTLVTDLPRLDYAGQPENSPVPDVHIATIRIYRATSPVMRRQLLRTARQFSTISSKQNQISEPKLFSLSTTSPKPDPRTSELMAPLNHASQVCVTWFLQLPDETACCQRKLKICIHFAMDADNPYRSPTGSPYALVCPLSHGLS